MQELEYETDVATLESDTFRTFVEKFFAAAAATADRDVLLQQLKDRTGVDIQEKTDKGEMPNDMVDKLLSASSVEIFPVQLPTKDTGFHAVSVYLDDKGVAKSLEENIRVSGLVQACGYPGQTFRGDCFVGRVFDDTEDEWRRMDFTLKDCSTDADWIQQTKMQRANRKQGDLQSLANSMGVNNPAQINPSTLAADAPQGETADYSWKQSEDEVEVTFKKDGLQKGDKKFVKVAFGRKRLKVSVKDQVIIDSALAGNTTADECTWTLSDGILQVTLAKADGDTWP
ncbi:Tnni3k [Symbiodinium natans]|uniref:Tnni3k protein n=1 Tax=Symbiodinium natans TaxID=878477 RepID=A0A812KKA6_9DINO|nr:Tnni3k [Symbiodinium natans]